ncbi:unnamed protein product [Caenorhabditis angaria]|uniref:Uncharacterized protein n=1 Tax=Caenorhabditis angaria TaxID=860376 RepID=A0A9P1IEB1_9PELO|nr:unnamed protein product [Caenorhabditis angaria]
MFQKISIFLLVVVLISNVLADMYDDDSGPISEDFDTQICGKNEVWMICSSCEQQCGSEPNMACPKVCQPARCQCPAHKGYKRDEQGNCVFCHVEK